MSSWRPKMMFGVGGVLIWIILKFNQFIRGFQDQICGLRRFGVNKIHSQG